MFRWDLRKKVKRPWRIVALAVLIPGMALWFYTWSLWSSYAYLPRDPNPVDGRIFPRGIHGLTVYQTLPEQNRLDRFLRVSIAISALGFALAAIEEERWRGKNR